MIYFVFIYFFLLFYLFVYFALFSHNTNRNPAQSGGAVKYFPTQSTTSVLKWR